MAHRLSASKRPLSALCLFWARGDVALPPSTAGACAALGSAFAEASEDAGAGLEECLGEAIEWREAADLDAIAERWRLAESQRDALEDLHATWRAWWPTFSAGRSWRFEVPFAYDTAKGTAREV